PEAGFKFICPSRPGYLRSPLEVGRTAEEQADALAALLDALGIEKAALLACSAGGPISVQFCLRHPDRIWALVMGSAINEPLSPLHGLMHPVAKALFGWDWLTWFGVNRIVLYALRPNLGLQTRRDAEKQEKVRDMLRSMYPTSLRRDGFLNDVEQFQKAPCTHLEEVHVPTLVIHGTADRVVPYPQGERSAALIPGAEFLTVPGGTHLGFISHYELIYPALKAFLEVYQPEESCPERIAEPEKIGSYSG
ncbi:MAG TPA: alpha/beta hydrolase, partial [Anaerolineales bacterium]|nr:alpha/beta hydrolase [Anaerolineales bacterium]